MELSVLFNVLTFPKLENKLDLSTVNWVRLYQLLIRHRLWHQIQQSSILLQHDTPQYIQDQLSNHCKTDQSKILLMFAETIKVAKIFNQNNLQFFFIKGLVLNALVYDEINTRPCSDLDIWVHADNYIAAVTHLKNLGYQQKLPNYELTKFKKRYYMTHKHDMAFYNPEKQILIELHFRLSYFGVNFFNPTSAMLKTIKLFNTPIYTLQDDYHLLYLMIHGAIHAWIRLRWLNDIALFIRRERCDLINVMRLAKQIHCEHIVQQSLILVHDLIAINTPILQHLIKNPSKRVIKITNIAKQFIHADYEMQDGIKNLRMFLKYRQYLYTLAVKDQKLNAIIGDLFKIDMLFKKINLPYKLSFLYYILYFGWIIRYTICLYRRIN